MFCCTFVGTLLAQLAALAGLVKIERDNAALVRIRGGILRARRIGLVAAAFGLTALGGAVAFASLSSETAALAGVTHSRLCSVLGVATPAGPVAPAR